MSAVRVARLRDRGDEGFTITELVVTMLILAIFMAMTTLIIVNVLGESAGQRATLSGVQQAQLAERTFGQYLRSTTAINYISSDGNDLVFATNVGTTDSNGVVNPSTETVEAELCTTANAKVDSLEVIFGLPSGSTGIQQCLNGSTPPTSLPAGVRLVQAFYIQPPTSPIFSFYTLSTSGSNAQPQVSAMALIDAIASVGSTSSTSIQAIGLDATFLPPPGPKVQGYASEIGTVVQTVAFLRNKETTSS